ncbi:MAG: hypothetical protein GY791_16025 [Alphaproteobacteria bacterium]|nr:hypothetical protein [Alphaproteobacteria bacterium]
MRTNPVPMILAAGALAVSATSFAYAANDPVVIELTQIGCQFVESENGVNHGFMPQSADDCNKINARTGDERLEKAKVLELKPGKYVFRVTNKDVPYELGFWLREHDYNWANPLHKLTKVSVSGGGLAVGTTKDYVVELEEGDYVYSCPLNPTPDYRLMVRS